MDTEDAPADLADLVEQVRSARLWARYRDWEDSTHRDLIQLPGFSYELAWTAVAGEPITGVHERTALEASHIVELHHQMRARLDTAASPVTDGRAEKDLIAEAARQTIIGRDPFRARVRLTTELANRGMSEIVLPGYYDPEFWTAVLSGDQHQITEYLAGCERAWHPLDSRRRSGE